MNRIKKLESKIPKKTRDLSYKYTFEDWEMVAIKGILLDKNLTPEVIEKWNSTNWGDHSVYLEHFSVGELRKLERMVLEGEFDNA